MPIANITDEMSANEKGDKVLSGKIYKDETFEDFTVNPLIGRMISILDTSFENCKVSKGSFMLMKGTVLKNVSFTNFDCGDVMHISSEASLNNVKIVGERSPKMIWIRPEEKENVSINDDISIDISEYEGEVSITGVSVKNISVNPTSHVVLKAELLGTLNWKEIGLSGLSYWKFMEKKVASDNSIEGIFSVPPKNSKNFDRSMEELKILRDLGHVK
jgi:hypothetical protein